MNSVQDHHIDKRAIANEEFKFKCKNCGNLMVTTPGAPGSAQTKCKQCGHTMLYHVDPPKTTGDENVPLPARVKLSPSQKFPGDFQINIPLEINKRYIYLCANPDCSRVGSFAPREIGLRKRKCKWCSTTIHYQVVESETIDAQQAKCAHQSRGQQKVKTEPVQPPVCAEAFIAWRSMWNLHKVAIDKDVTVIGRDDKDNPCDIMIKDKYMSACSLEIKKEFAASGGVIYLATVRRATNPVLIQQREYPVNSSIYLNDGDIIKMGKTTFTFKLRKDKT